MDRIQEAVHELTAKYRLISKLYSEIEKKQRELATFYEGPELAEDINRHKQAASHAHRASESALKAAAEWKDRMADVWE